MTRADNPLLVFGATGRQGGAVASELLRRHATAHALVRDPDSPAASALAREGATLVRGDLNDPLSLHTAMHDMAGVFSVQTFRGPDGVAGEERQGRAVADAAHRAGISHLVYSSVGGAERHSGIPHFESKGRIEAYIRELGLPATILRPTFFIDNFERLGPDRADGELVLRLALDPDTPLQMIATQDIGTIATETLLNPVEYRGAQIEIAGDQLTPRQMAEIFARVSGMPVRFERQPLDELGEDSAAMFEWLDRDGYHADLPTLRRTHPDLMTLESWLRRTRWTPRTPR